MVGGVGMATRAEKRFKTSQFKVDGMTIPAPSSYTYNEEDLSTEGITGRTLDGIMHKDVVAVKDTYSCVWKRLSWEEAAAVLTAVKGKTKVQFTHADPCRPNVFITGTYYIGKRECVANDLNNPVNTWREIKMTFIEI